MSILLSRPVQETLQKNDFFSRILLQQIMAKFGSLNTSNLEGDSSVRRVTSATEEIYVMRIKNLRVFFTKKGGDLVLLSIENG
ncbi:hypothetical protein [Serratia marcescens]|uniref:hypothetical protein n=1 Tax=Serratia marcescens TaxID=615 RepID=UPI00132E9C07|nr:hypothetical protein [Serratia marcescens]BBO62621.1 hypothetical protein SMATCC274_18840 [Serratia marcescens]